ncbi:repeat, PF09479 [Atopobium sp. BS2]|uniref:beta strand repeat-containing protein n=1 Tax=Atopobium sp. BS2 TaxID=936550 RepID=UPI00044B4C48|nr:InlB B-repeat-containing protein [Atopobium sp. BS2]EWC94234.1 repeat, PF09479 [Atopobium sp. BS2]
MDKKEKNLASKGAKTAMSLVLALSLVPSSALAEVAGTQEVAQTQEVAATQTVDTTASSEATDQVSTEASTSTEATTSEQNAEQGTVPAEGSSRRVARSLSVVSTELWVDGTNGNDANDGSSANALKSLQKALELWTATPTINTIHLKGNLELTSTVTIPAGVTLKIESEGATLTGTGNSIDGLVLANGATLTGSGTLTMSGFKTALTAQRGSTITDGTYVFRNNAGASGSRGISLAGTVKGSTNKNSVTITADDKSNTNFYESGITFENATISVASQARTWFDARDLNLKNADLTVKGFGQTFYVDKLNMTDSTLTINPSWYGATGMTIQGTSNIVNSTINANAGSTSGISVGVAGGTVNVTNSTLNFTNGGTGGLNVNTGDVIINNSTIKGDGYNSGALFGAQTNGSIQFTGNSLVETPATKNSDNGAGQTRQNYNVVGGSYLIKYAPSYNSSLGSTIPTNGAANGNEALSLFTLADASTNSLSLINANGATYTYPVANASSDGQKHVWAPAATVTFDLNTPGVTGISPTFADGTTANKTAFAMRGNSLATASSVAEGTTTLPADPYASGQEFDGWYYTDAAGTEHQFTADTQVTSDMTVYPHWKANTAWFYVRYHNGNGVSVIDRVATNTSRTVTVRSDAEVNNLDNNFNIAGKTFKRWTTQANGAGDEVAASSNLAVPAGTDTVDLYADWEEQHLTVSFSANGGTFSANSVFKQNPNVFDITTDANGGEVATIKTHPTVAEQTTINALLQNLSGNTLTTDTAGIASSTSTNTNTAYTEIATLENYVLDNAETPVTFFGIVVGHNYHYWFTDAAGNSAATIDGGATLTNDVTYYLKWKEDPSIQKIELTGDLPADMWSDSQNNTTQIKEVSNNQSFSLTGAIDATSIVSQMTAFENGIAGGLSDLTKITLSGTTSTFTAKLTLPEGVVVPANPTVTTSGLGDLFEVTDVSVNGQEVTVTMTLKGSYSNYQQLKDAVETVGKDDAATSEIARPLTVTVDGLTLDPTKVTNGQELTATGTLTGTFKSYAKNTITNVTKKYELSWNGVQIAANRDPRGNDIQQTLIVNNPIEMNLPADMLADENTEHDQVITMKAGTTFNLTGSILASSIQEQMNNIERAYPNTNHDTISLSNLKFKFTATLTVPEGMTLPSNLTASSVQTSNFGSGFKVSDVQVNGRTVAITFELSDPSSIRTYSDLERIVDEASAGDGWMKLTIPGVTIDSNVAAGTQLTAVGTVTGSFSASADSAAGNHKAFSFIWNGVQWADGKDAVATDNDTIQLTITVAEDETPETPATPSKPSKKKKKTPYTGDASAAAPLAALLAGMTAVMTSLGITKRRKNK